MHESEAKAYLLRDLRIAKQKLAEFYKIEHKFDSKKHVQAFLETYREAHELVTLFEYKKPTRHAWHYKHTFFYLEPTAFDEEGMGKLIVAQQSTLDSKKLIKNDLEELLQVHIAKDTVFHSHFFIRLIQRAGLKGLKPALDLVAHSLAVLLLHNKYESHHFKEGQKVYMVFKDKIFVLNCETEQGVLIYKTILLVEFMTDKQKRFFKPAIEAAMRSKHGFLPFEEVENELVLIQ